MGEGEGRKVDGDVARPLAKPGLIGNPTGLCAGPVIGADGGRGQGRDTGIGGPSRHEIAEEKPGPVGVDQPGKLFCARVEGGIPPAVAGTAEQEEHRDGEHQ
jgi:hypothetical protein